jgi:glutathione S-transferase
MRDCTQPAQEERYQISTLLQTGRQHSKIVRYGNVLAARFQISYSQESNHRLYLRVESVFLNENVESGWFVGKSMSIADLAMWRLLGWLRSGVLDGVPTNILENFTGLQQLHNRVDSLPKVGKWMERHYGK